MDELTPNNDSFVISLLLGALVWFLLSLAISPQIPEDGVQVLEKADIWSTSAQMVSGVELSFPNVSTEPISMTVYALNSFSVVPSDTVVVPPGESHTVTLSTQAGKSLPAGVYDAAVGNIGNKTQRPVGSTVAQPSFVAVALVLVGLFASFLIARWGKIRPGRELAAQTALLLAAICRHNEDNEQTVDSKYRKFSIIGKAQAIVGLAVQPADCTSAALPSSPTSVPEPSILELIRAEKTDEAQEAYDHLEAFYQSFQGFIAQIQNLRKTYEDVKSNIPGTKIEIGAGEFLLATTGNNETEIESEEALASLTKKAAAYSSAYGLLLRVYGRYQIGQEILRKLTPHCPDQWTSEDYNLYVSAKSDLEGANSDLWKAASFEEAETWRVEELSENALITLRRLLVKYPPAAPKAASIAWTQSYEDWISDLLSLLAAITELIPINPNDPASDSLKEAADRARKITKYVDMIILNVGWIVAGVTAVTVLYVQQPFGSTWLDYAYALLWGIGVERALTGLQAVLGKFGV